MKKILLSLFWIITFWLINFWSCSTVDDILNTTSHVVSSVSVTSTDTFVTVVDFWEFDSSTVCFKFDNMSVSTNIQVGPYTSQNPWYLNRNQWYYYRWAWAWNYTCVYVWSDWRYLNVSVPNPVTFDVEYFFMNTFLDTTLPVMTSFECQQNYDLIPISSVDSNYCEINNLCPSWWWECIISGSWFSDIYIYSNNRYFPLTWTNSVFINLPQYLTYNYDYSNWWDDLDIDIWYSVDDSYLSSVKDLQLTTPNQVDLNNIVSWLLPLFVPWLVVILFLYFVFRFLKKIF